MPRRTQVDAKKLDATEKKIEILNLRRHGHTYMEIGRRVGCDESYARRIVKEEFARLKEEQKEAADDIVHTELARLEEILTGFYPKAISGDAKSAEIVLRIMERRSRLLGLDAPTKTQATINVNQKTDAELIEEARALGITVPVELEESPNVGTHES